MSDNTEIDHLKDVLRHTSIDPKLIKMDIQKEKVLGVKVTFPEEISGNPRIRYDSGDRLIDWENGEWVSYVKEGVRWYIDELTEEDFKVMYEILKPKNIKK